MDDHMKQQYEKIFNQYLAGKQESDLYDGQQLSKLMIEQGMSPEEMVSLHIETVKKYIPELPDSVMHSFDLLLEVMVGYGFQHLQHQRLREQQYQLRYEMEVAAGMQHTLLPPVPDDIPAIDLGVLSEAAQAMSGDYYHFFYENKAMLGVAVADIIGKGIPAALCMSMIKYAIESLPKEQRLDPGFLLENINRVVEKNIDPSMFITMIYGSYDLEEHCFYYATAGHEPGLYYSRERDAFEELQTKGVVLGLRSESTYQNFQQPLDSGDMLVLYSDGVTETRRNGQFIEREEWTNLIDLYKSLPAQEMVERLHQELLKWCEYELNDDQTIIVLKREV